MAIFWRIFDAFLFIPRDVSCQYRHMIPDLDLVSSLSGVVAFWVGYYLFMDGFLSDLGVGVGVVEYLERGFEWFLWITLFVVLVCLREIRIGFKSA